MSLKLGAGVRIEVVEGWVEMGFGFVAVYSVLYMGGRIAGCWTCDSMLFVGRLEKQLDAKVKVL
jgi:hypothetical protein